MTKKPPVRRILWVHAFSSTAESRHGGRHRRLQEDLRKHGVDITVVACTKSHLEPGRKLTPEQKADTNIIWIPGFSSGANVILRLANIITFFCCLLIWGVRHARHYDLVVGSSPDPLAAWGACQLAKKVTKTPFVLEVRDVWPETLITLQGYKPWHPYILFLAFLERRLYANAALILSTLPNLESYVRSFGSNKSVLHIPNYIDESQILEADKLNEKQDGLKIIYAGTFGVANNLENFLRAVAIVNQSNPNAKVKVDIYGDGPMKDGLMDKFKDIKEVEFHDRISRIKILRRMEEADVGVICWRNIDLYRHGISANKVPDYLMKGLPIVMSYGYRHAIDEFGAGFLVAPEDAVELALALEKLLYIDGASFREMQLASLRLAREKYCFEGFGALLVASLIQLASEKHVTAKN